MAFLSLAAVGMTRAAAGYRTALALVIPTLARERKAILASKKVREYPMLPPAIAEPTRQCNIKRTQLNPVSDHPCMLLSLGAAT